MGSLWDFVREDLLAPDALAELAVIFAIFGLLVVYTGVRLASLAWVGVGGAFLVPLGLLVVVVLGGWWP